MRSLQGIKIRVDGRERFVGRVGDCPAKPFAWLHRYRIFYREVVWRDCFLRTMGAASVDAAAWALARRMGATCMVCWCADKGVAIYVTAAQIEASPTVDMGERQQYRIASPNYRLLGAEEGAGPIAIGYCPAEHVVLARHSTAVGPAPDLTGQLPLKEAS